MSVFVTRRISDAGLAVLDRAGIGFEVGMVDEDCPLPEIVQSVPHVAFEVDDLEEALSGHEILIEPNRPGPGVRVAFVLVDGAPVEFLEYDGG